MSDFHRQALLVLQAQSGDRAAWESLLGEIQADLLPYVSGLAGIEGAEDVVQETLLQICRNLKWLRTPEVFRAWAYRLGAEPRLLISRENAGGRAQAMSSPKWMSFPDELW